VLLFGASGCLKNPQPFRNRDELRKGSNLHLLHHSMAMSFNGPYRRPQLGCNLFVDLASNNKFENLSFPRGQEPREATETIQLAALIPLGLIRGKRAFNCLNQLIGRDRYWSERPGRRLWLSLR
jgi:hypothetical protein